MLAHSPVHTRTRPSRLHAILDPTFYPSLLLQRLPKQRCSLVQQAVRLCSTCASHHHSTLGLAPRSRHQHTTRPPHSRIRLLPTQAVRRAAVQQQPSILRKPNRSAERWLRAVTTAWTAEIRAVALEVTRCFAVRARRYALHFLLMRSERHFICQSLTCSHSGTTTQWHRATEALPPTRFS